MVLGTTAALLLAGGTFAATTQVMAGNQQAKSIQKQTEFNAQVYEQQAEMIQQKRKIQDAQYAREGGRLMGSIVSQTAGKGLMLSGSPLAILADSESQLLFDQAIGNYNLDVERNAALSGAAYQRFTGADKARVAKYTGYSNAFSTALGMLNLKPGQGVKP